MKHKTSMFRCVMQKLKDRIARPIVLTIAIIVIRLTGLLIRIFRFFDD